MIPLSRSSRGISSDLSDFFLPTEHKYMVNVYNSQYKGFCVEDRIHVCYQTAGHVQDIYMLQHQQINTHILATVQILPTYMNF